MFDPNSEPMSPRSQAPAVEAVGVEVVERVVAALQQAELPAVLVAPEPAVAELVQVLVQARVVAAAAVGVAAVAAGARAIRAN